MGVAVGSRVVGTPRSRDAPERMAKNCSPAATRRTVTVINELSLSPCTRVRWDQRQRGSAGGRAGGRAAGGRAGGRARAARTVTTPGLPTSPHVQSLPDPAKENRQPASTPREPAAAQHKLATHARRQWMCAARWQSPRAGLLCRRAAESRSWAWIYHTHSHTSPRRRVASGTAAAHSSSGGGTLSADSCPEVETPQPTTVPASAPHTPCHVVEERRGSAPSSQQLTGQRQRVVDIRADLASRASEQGSTSGAAAAAAARLPQRRRRSQVDSTWQLG